MTQKELSQIVSQPAGFTIQRRQTQSSEKIATQKFRHFLCRVLGFIDSACDLSRDKSRDCEQLRVIRDSTAAELPATAANGRHWSLMDAIGRHWSHFGRNCRSWSQIGRDCRNQSQPTHCLNCAPNRHNGVNPTHDDSSTMTPCLSADSHILYS